MTPRRPRTSIPKNERGARNGPDLFETLAIVVMCAVVIGVLIAVASHA